MNLSAGVGVSRRRLEIAALGIALILGLATAAATNALPIPAVAVAVVAVAGIIAFGPELVIVLALVAGAGLVPFIDPSDFAAAGIKNYFVFFGIAVGTMIATWAGRLIAGRPSWPLKPNVTLVLVLVLLGYVGLVMLATDPLAQPNTAAPFIEFPVTALAAYLWLSHEDALDGVKRVLPFAVVIVLAWAVLYVLAAAGCGGCLPAVGSDLQNEGLLGPSSRVYTSGQNSLLALVLVAFGLALRRATPLTLGLAALGLLCVALQASRAQYFGMAIGMIVLIAWRLRNSSPGGRVILGVATVVTFTLLLSSPVGERALTAYEDVSTASGTAGYRVGLVEKASKHWSLFGNGVTSRTIRLGVNEDLGVSNTFIVIGFLGGALVATVLVSGAIRGLRSGTLAGATLAAMFALVLTTRASLPLLEYGHAAITYGGAVGVAASLALPRRSAALSRSRRPLQRQLGAA